MDIVDRDLAAAEADCQLPTPSTQHRYQPRSSHEIERVPTTSSTSGSSTLSSRVDGGRLRSISTANMSRVPTQPDLERHPTAISRIATARSQHSQTVGRTLTNRSSKRPLPSFGGGKPFPPGLAGSGGVCGGV